MRKTIFCTFLIYLVKTKPIILKDEQENKSKPNLADFFRVWASKGEPATRKQSPI